MGSKLAVGRPNHSAFGATNQIFSSYQFLKFWLIQFPNGVYTANMIRRRNRIVKMANRPNVFRSFVTVHWCNPLDCAARPVRRRARYPVGPHYLSVMT